MAERKELSMPSLEKPTKPAGSLKERQREERARLILEAAQTILLERGYHETSIDDIAAQVGIAKGTVYLHFPSKEDLMIALVERQLQNFVQVIEAVAASTSSARQRLEAILQRTYDPSEARRMQIFLEVFGSADMRSRFAEKHERTQPIIDHVRHLLREIIEQGKAQGEFDPQISTKVMIVMYLNLLSPRNYHHLTTDQTVAFEELLPQIIQIFFHGISRK